jgi:hypothetical protein
MARGETGGRGKTEEDYRSTEPATEGPAKTHPIGDATDSEQRAGHWIAEPRRLSGTCARPETDAAQPGETYRESRRKSAGCQSYSGWFTESTGRSDEISSSEFDRGEADRYPGGFAGGQTHWYAGSDAESAGRQTDAADHTWAVT